MSRTLEALIRQRKLKQLYTLTRKELEDMINKHRVENEEWINARKQELEEERHRLELEKVFCKIADFNFDIF